jgi:hypothetical protein
MIIQKFSYGIYAFTYTTITLIMSILGIYSIINYQIPYEQTSNIININFWIYIELIIFIILITFLLLSYMLIFQELYIAIYLYRSTHSNINYWSLCKLAYLNNEINSYNVTKAYGCRTIYNSNYWLKLDLIKNSDKIAENIQYTKNIIDKYTRLLARIILGSAPCCTYIICNYVNTLK